MKVPNTETGIPESDALMCSRGQKSISYHHIIMLRADSNYTEICLSDGSSYLSSTTLGILEKRLTGSGFFRLNRSVLINLNYLENFSLNEEKVGIVKLKENTQQILVSRRRKPLLINLLIKKPNHFKKY